MNPPRRMRIERNLRVPLELVERPVSVVQRLVIENRGSGASKHPYLRMAAIDDLSDELVLPRAYDASGDLLPLWRGRVSLEVELLDRRFWWERTVLGTRTPQLGPNEYIAYDQRPAWQALCNPPAWPWGRILALGCGKGKTVLGLRLAQYRGVPTLVICHTLGMMETWAAEARNTFGVPTSAIGFIGGGRLDWRKPLVFSTMPGILCRDYPPEFFERFGLVIFDEGDLLGATELSKILPLFLGERVLLTATVERSDGNHVLYFNHVGPVCFTDTTPDLQPECFVIDSATPRRILVKTKGRKQPVSQETQGYAWRGKPVANIPKTINRITKHVPSRAEWARSVVLRLLKKGRKVLFLGERIASLEAHNRYAQKHWGDFVSGCVFGESRMEDGEAARVLRTCDIIWAIQQIAKRGLNEKAIDTVVLEFCTYKDNSRTQQTIGRALRFMTGKNIPYVVLLNDPNVPVLNDNCEHIAGWLRDQGYPVEWYTHD